MKKLTAEEFIEKAKIVHGDKFDYSYVVYNNAHTPVIIGCINHGPFQLKPTDHLSKNMECPLCPGKHHHSNKETFVEKSTKVHGNKYDYSLVDYRGAHAKVQIICNIHGIFEMTPVHHFSLGQGCKKCGYETIGNRYRTSLIHFMKKASSVHGERYDYSKVSYINNKTKVEIICKKHGSFFQAPDAHTNSKQGCMKCFNENVRGGLGGYTEGWFVLHPERVNLPTQLYIVEMSCETDNFIKVGITINSVKQRYSRSRVGDKYINKNVLNIIHTTLYDAYKMKQNILSSLRDFKYFPNYVFDGRTECLKNNQEVLLQIEKIINETK